MAHLLRQRLVCYGGLPVLTGVAAGEEQTMANQGQNRSFGLEGLSAAAQAAAVRGAGAAEWNPPFCGDLDIRIKTDGSWHYLGSPLGRPAMVRLFSTLLRREGERYFLVTPVEKVGIQVDDAPFLAVEMVTEGDADARSLRFRTNVDDWVNCDCSHPLRFEAVASGGLAPYLHVGRGLWAKVTRALWYDLVELGEERRIAGQEMFGIASRGAFFPMSPAQEMRAAG